MCGVGVVGQEAQQLGDGGLVEPAAIHFHGVAVALAQALAQAVEVALLHLDEAAEAFWLEVKGLHRVGLLFGQHVRKLGQQVAAHHVHDAQAGFRHRPGQGVCMVGWRHREATHAHAGQVTAQRVV